MTLRNVDKRPRPDFVKAYAHNGYFKSLREIVHFYNTREHLPRCQAGAAGEKVSCWPAPEDAENINTNCCDFGLSDAQETTLSRFSRSSLTKHSSPDQPLLSGISCKTPGDFGIALVGFVLLTVWRAPPLVLVIISALGGIALAQAIS